MRHHKDRLARIPHPGQNTHDLIRLLRVETRRRLIHNNDLLTRRNNAGKSKLLPLAPAQMTGIHLRFAGKAHGRKRSRRRSIGLADVPQTEQDLLLAGVFKQHRVRVLEHQTHMLRDLRDRPAGDVLTLQQDRLIAAANAQGNFEFSAQWAGQGAYLAREMPASQLVATLVEELQ